MSHTSSPVWSSQVRNFESTSFSRFENWRSADKDRARQTGRSWDPDLRGIIGREAEDCLPVPVSFVPMEDELEPNLTGRFIVKLGHFLCGCWLAWLHGDMDIDNWASVRTDWSVLKVDVSSCVNESLAKNQKQSEDKWETIKKYERMKLGFDVIYLTNMN